MTTNIMLTVGIGEGATVILGVIADGNVVCNIVLNKHQVENHAAVLLRHAALLPDVERDRAASLN
jgi:hypothetical protein